MKTLAWLFSVFFFGAQLSGADLPADLSSITLKDVPPFASAVSNMFSVFELPIKEQMRFRISHDVIGAPLKISFESDTITVDTFVKDQFVWFAGDNGASRAMWKREKLPPAVKPAVSQRADMEAKARAYVARLGIQLGPDHRYWEGHSGVYPGNYDVKRQVWTFLWHRHLGKIPVFNDHIILTLDDLSGKLLYFTSMARPYRYGPELKPVITLDAARTRAMQHFVAKRLGTIYADRTKTTIGTHARTFLCYYVQEELRPEKLKLLKDPKDDQRLRLCYGIYVGSWDKGKESEPLAPDDVVLVDAVTGEEVVRNVID